MASLPERPGYASTRKAEAFWILMRQDMMGWQWHWLDHMQINVKKTAVYTHC